MITRGIVAAFHDPAAAIVIDGEVIAAAGTLGTPIATLVNPTPRTGERHHGQ